MLSRVRVRGIAISLKRDFQSAVEDEPCARLFIRNAEYTRCEIELAARREMIVKLEDFMRRRSKIEEVVRPMDIIDAPGLLEACQILFGSEAGDRLAEYRATLPGR